MPRSPPPSSFCISLLPSAFFFFQAEDGIRDYKVTGVQTCALPIFGQSLLGVLRAELSAQRSKARAYLAAPSAEFLRKNAPCLVLYLYDLRPFIDVRDRKSVV